MNDIIPLGDLGERTDLLPLFESALPQHRALRLALCDAGIFDSRIFKARGKAAAHQQHLARLRLTVRLRDRTVNAALLQIVPQDRERFLRTAADRDAVAALAELVQILCENPRTAAPRRILRRFNGKHLLELKAACAAEKGVHADERALLRLCQHCICIQKVFCKLPAHHAVLQHRLDILRIPRLQALPRIQKLAGLTERDPAGEIIKNRRRLVVDQRKIEVDIQQRDAAFELVGIGIHILLQLRRLPAAHRLCKRPDLLRQTRIRQRLDRRNDIRLRNGIGTALCFRLEPRHAVDLVAPEFHAQRHRILRRENIKDRAAHRKLSRRIDLIAAQIAHCGQRITQRILLAAPAGLQMQRPRTQRSLRQRKLHNGFRRGRQHTAFSRAERIERRETQMLVFTRNSGGINEIHFL